MGIMSKQIFFDIVNLCTIGLLYLLLIVLTLFTLDFFNMHTTGSLFLSSLSSITVIQIFNHAEFNGLLTLFALITVIVIACKSIHLYTMER